MAELATIRINSNAIVSAGNDINSALSSFSWSKSFDGVNAVAREIDNLQRAVAKLAEMEALEENSASDLIAVTSRVVKSAQDYVRVVKTNSTQPNVRKKPSVGGSNLQAPAELNSLTSNVRNGVSQIVDAARACEAAYAKQEEKRDAAKKKLALVQYVRDAGNVSQRIAPLMDCEKTNMAAYDREYNELMTIVNNFLNGLSNSSSRSLIQGLAQEARNKNAAFRARPDDHSPLLISLTQLINAMVGEVNKN